ncbi:MAG: DMT family transporter [Lachnospiraceae bacterium]|nr:DMT family transporter [Lachnospiraceae bacterium]
MKDTERRGALILTAASVLWGSTFVAQSVANLHMGPYTFIFARNALAVILLTAFLLLSGRMKERPEGRGRLWLGGFLIGTALFAASAFQQVGMLTTSVGKSGFLTATYLVMLPLFGFFTGRRPGRRVWWAVLLAMAGMYFLCMRPGDLTLARGDVLMLLCAVTFTCQILLVSRYGKAYDGVKLSCLEFLFCSLEAGVFALLFEKPAAAQFVSGWLPVVYAGIVSNCLAYTMQIYGQRTVPVAVAGIIMSMESVFALLSGWVMLRQGMTGRELFGSALIFAAVLLTQMPEKRTEEKKT